MHYPTSLRGTVDGHVLRRANERCRRHRHAFPAAEIASTKRFDARPTAPHKLQDFLALRLRGSIPSRFRSQLLAAPSAAASQRARAAAEGWAARKYRTCRRPPWHRHQAARATARRTQKRTDTSGCAHPPHPIARKLPFSRARLFSSRVSIAANFGRYSPMTAARRTAPQPSSSMYFASLSRTLTMLLNHMFNAHEPAAGSPISPQTSWPRCLHAAAPGRRRGTS